MSERYLLLLEAGQLSVFLWRSRQLTATAQFLASEGEAENFAAYLNIHHDARFDLLANLADECQINENMPLLRGSDRRTVIARKTAQHFPAASLCCAQSLGREKGTRHDEKLLISAFPDNAPFQPWLAVIKSSGVALAGIYSTSQLGGPLLARLCRPPPQCLLLCLLGNTLRETWLDRGCAVFSRLITKHDENLPSTARRFVEEAGRLHEYLLGQRRITRETRLPVFILAHPQAVAAFREAAAGMDNLAFTIIDNHAAARRLKLLPLPDDSSCTRLFLHLLASHPPRQQFADREWCRNFHLAQARRLIVVFSLALLLVAALIVAANLQQIVAIREGSEQSRRAAQSIERDREAIVTGIPTLDIDHESLRQLVGTYEQLVGQPRQPASAFFMLGRILDQLDEFDLDSLDWRLAGSPLQAGTTQQVITLDGHLRIDGDGPPRLAQASLEKFGAMLQASSPCRDEASTARLVPAEPAAGEDEENEDQMTPRFSLRIHCQQ